MNDRTPRHVFRTIESEPGWLTEEYVRVGEGGGGLSGQERTADGEDADGDAERGGEGQLLRLRAPAPKQKR